MRLTLNPAQDILAFGPEMLLCVVGIVLFGIGCVSRRRYPIAAPLVAVLGFLGSLCWTATQIGADPKLPFLGAFAADAYTVYFRLLFGVVGILVTLSASAFFRRREQAGYAEFFGLLVLTVFGLQIMAGAAELITLFIAIELVSIASYVMAGYLRTEARSSEAGLKYFLFGAAASAIMVYGLSLLYGIAGTTRLYSPDGAPLLAAALARAPMTVQPLAVILVIAGFAFKMAVVPFHWWSPDVYEGAPTPVTAFLSVGPKAGGFALFLRLFAQGDNSLYRHWPYVMAVLAALTMFIGNWGAIWQVSIKRMLAYSSIAHAGYLLIGVVTWNGSSWDVAAPGGMRLVHSGPTGVLFYLAAYVFMNVGAFAVAIAVQRRTGTDAIPDYAGLAQTSPYLAAGMALFLLSLAGVPPLAGFFGKYYVFSAAIRDERFFWLAVVGVINSVIALYYYMRVVMQMYFRAPKAGVAAAPPAAVPLGLRAAVAVALLATLLLGILPDQVVRFITASTPIGGPW